MTLPGPLNSQPPSGNLVNYGGSVDVNLWSTNVPAPSSQYITGTKPDGSPSYMVYDPTGESTRGLPQPRYGELKSFGYVPKPGQVGVYCPCAAICIVAAGTELSSAFFADLH